MKTVLVRGYRLNIFRGPIAISIVVLQAITSFSCRNSCHERTVGYYKESNNLEYEGCLDKNGKVHGQFLEYYQNGSVKRKTTFEHGAYEGEYTVFYPNGDTFVSALYMMDRLMELIKYNDKNGNPIPTHGFTKGNGRIFEYDIGGNLKGFGNLENGLIVGYWHLYSKNGMVDSMFYSKDANNNFYGSVFW